MADENRKTVLVVDDQIENQLILEDLLESNYSVVTFSSGEEVVAYLKQGGMADLILMDINMPGLIGFDVCKIIKEDERTASIPVILVSGLIDQNDREMGQALGVVAFLNKPFSFPEVIASVERFAY